MTPAVPVSAHFFNESIEQAGQIVLLLVTN